MAATVGTISHRIGQAEREFGLLSVEDLVSLTNTAPSVNGEIIDIYTLDKWARHPRGCVHFVLASARKLNPKLTFEEVSQWGSVLRRTQVAVDILTRSLISGEEPDELPKATGEQAPETGGSKPA